MTIIFVLKWCFAIGATPRVVIVLAALTMTGWPLWAATLIMASGRCSRPARSSPPSLGG